MNTEAELTAPEETDKEWSVDDMPPQRRRQAVAAILVSGAMRCRNVIRKTDGRGSKEGQQA
ncbi:MAG: hypothetical protein ACOC95_00850 [Planctomycetota bacterium]